MTDESLEELACNAIVKLPGNSEREERVRIMARNDATGKADVMFPYGDRVTMRIPYSMIVREF